ncbi:MAG: SDR family NAD(P)-dependent oxidoreductase [Planktomarina sp.]
MTDTTSRPTRVLITGGSAGIGAALAQAYADDGADVLTIGRRTSVDHSVPYHSIDMTTQGAMGALDSVLAGAGWDEFDILVLNAGLGHVGPLADTPPAVVDAMMAINVTVPMQMAHHYANRVNKRIVFVGSVATWGKHPNFAIYAATKAALRGAVNSWQIERNDDLVQIIHPGPTESEMHDRAGLKPTLMRKIFTPATIVAREMKAAIQLDKREVKFGMPFTLRHAFAKGRG